MTDCIYCAPCVSCESSVTCDCGATMCERCYDDHGETCEGADDD